MSFLFLSFFYGFFQYFPAFEWNLEWFLNIITAGTLVLLAIFVELIFIMMIYDFYCLSIPAFQEFNKIRKNFSTNQNEFKKGVWINFYGFLKQADRFYIILVILFSLFIIGMVLKKLLF